MNKGRVFYSEILFYYKILDSTTGLFDSCLFSGFVKEIRDSTLRLLGSCFIFGDVKRDTSGKEIRQMGQPREIRETRQIHPNFPSTIHQNRHCVRLANCCNWTLALKKKETVIFKSSVHKKYYYCRTSTPITLRRLYETVCLF